MQSEARHGLKACDWWDPKLGSDVAHYSASWESHTPFSGILMFFPPSRRPYPCCHRSPECLPVLPCLWSLCVGCVKWRTQRGEVERGALAASVAAIALLGRLRTVDMQRRRQTSCLGHWKSCLAVRAGGPGTQDLKAISTGHCLVLPALAAANEPQLLPAECRTAEGEEMEGCDLRIRSSKSLLVRAWNRKPYLSGSSTECLLVQPRLSWACWSSRIRRRITAAEEAALEFVICLHRPKEPNPATRLGYCHYVCEVHVCFWIGCHLLASLLICVRFHFNPCSVVWIDNIYGYAKWIYDLCVMG